MPFSLIVLSIAAAYIAAAFFYVSKIISNPPEGRAEEYLKTKEQQNKK